MLEHFLSVLYGQSKPARCGGSRRTGRRVRRTLAGARAVLCCSMYVEALSTAGSRAKQTGTVNSAKGAVGVMKKVSYWVVIALAFGVAQVLIGLGAGDRRAAGLPAADGLVLHSACTF